MDPTDSKLTVNDDNTDFDDSSDRSRRPTYDDDDDALSDQSKMTIDLSKFFTKPKEEGEAPEDEDEEEEGDEEEYEDDEEEGDDEFGEFGAMDDLLPKETSSEEKARLIQEHKRSMAKQAKKALIREYLDAMKQLTYLKRRNVILGFKLEANNNQREEIIEKHMEMQKLMVDKVKEQAENLKKLALQESCKSEEKTEAEEERKQKRPKKKKGSSEHPLKPTSSSRDSRRTRFILEPSTDSNSPQDPLKHGKHRHKHKKPKQKLDLTVGVLKQLYMRAAKYGESRRMRGAALKSCKKQKKEKLVLFTNNRSLFLEQSPRNNQLQASENVFASEDPSRNHAPMVKITRHKTYTEGRKKTDFQLTKQGREYVNSKVDLGPSRQERGTLLVTSEEVDINNLHHFDFDFADPSLAARHVSAKIRDETLKVLEHRHIPTSQLAWPMHVKGFRYQSKNPYGRIQLNYTRISHHEMDHPHMAYRISLTNLAYFRMKEQRMEEKHQNNRFEMEEERQHLESATSQILSEIYKGLRIWAGLSGISGREKSEVKQQTEKLILDFQKDFDSLLDLITRLYRTIQKNEFALRSLSTSEGKGEGAQLHEFRDIMRGREKLKAERKSIQTFITRYQARSKKVLQNVRRSDEKMHEMTHSIRGMTVEIKSVKKEIEEVVNALHQYHDIALSQETRERELNKDMGILGHPAVLNEYEKLIAKKQETKIRKFEVLRKINGVVREVYRVTPRRPSSRQVNEEKGVLALID